MKIFHSIRRALLRVVFISFCLFALHSAAEADMIDDIANILQQTGEPLQGQNVTSGGLLLVKGLLTCISNGTDVVVCTDQFLTSPAGQQLAKNASLPSWVYLAIELYIDVKAGDYWGMFTKFGEMLVCALAQFFTSIDICGLIGALVDVAEAVYDAASAVVDFFSDLGEAIYGAVEDAYCAVFGCDDSPPPPTPEQLADAAYGAVFAPEITNLNALKAIEDVHADKFQYYKNTLVSKASSQFGSQAAQTALPRFIKAVDDQWTGDIAGKVLGELAAKRNEYSNNPQQVTAWAQQFCDDQYPLPPENGVAVLCADYFNTNLGYAHVNRWIQQHSQQAGALQAQTNLQWCQNYFLIVHKDEFATAARNCMKTKCPESGDSLLCNSVKDFQDCKAHMKILGKESQCAFTPTSAIQNRCTLNIQTQMYQCGSADDYTFCKDALKYFGKENLCGFTSALANQSAENVNNYLISKGSTIPCAYTPVTQPNKPVDFICKRPQQQKVCTQQSQPSLYPFVNCVLNEDPAYIALKNKVQQVVANLGSTYIALSLSPQDPLYARTLSKADDQLETDISKNFGFGPPSTKPGFIILHDQQPTIPIDGLSTPTVSLTTKYDVQIPKPPMQDNRNIEKGPPSKNPFPDPREVSPNIDQIAPIDQFNGKMLKNGDMLKIVNGTLNISSKSGGMKAVLNQTLELQDGTKLVIKGGKIVQQIKPGMSR